MNEKTDIVERLREDHSDGYGPAYYLMMEAADEIEHLRAMQKALADALARQTGRMCDKLAGL